MPRCRAAGLAAQGICRGARHARALQYAEVASITLPPCNTLQNLVRGSSLLPPLGAFGIQWGRSPGRAPVLLCSSAVKLLWDIGQRALLLLTWHLSPSLSSLLPI